MFLNLILMVCHCLGDFAYDFFYAALPFHCYVFPIISIAGVAFGVDGRVNVVAFLFSF